MAPDVEQMHVINHQTGEVAEGEQRNVLVESARIARGEVRNLAQVKASDLDALILPGGFGAAKNLSTFAVDGPDCRVNPEVARLIRDMHAAKKPIAAVCIAPTILSRVLGEDQIPHELTIGDNQDVAGAMDKMGSKHIQCPVQEYVVDKDNKLISSPAYMSAGSIAEAAGGIEKTVKVLLEMTG